MSLTKNGSNGGNSEELRLVKLYMELTGTTESQARNVLMRLGSQEETGTEARPNSD